MLASLHPVWVVAAAYVLGSVSFSLIVVRLLVGTDIREHGSGNAGATNVLRTAGRWPAILVLISDIGKGALAVGLARWAGVPDPWVGAAAVAAVAGHVFPIFHRFRGGKGVATVTGALGPLNPLAMLMSVVVFLVLVTWTRFVSLGSMAAIAFFPLAAWISGWLGWTPMPPAWLWISSIAVTFLIIVRHRGNLYRLWVGTERRLGERRSLEEST